MNRWGRALLGLAFAALVFPGAVAAEDRIGVLDSRLVLTTSKDGRAAEKLLKELLKEKKAELEPLTAELKKKREEFEAQRWVWRDEVRQEREYELVKLERDIERAMRSAEDDLEVERRKLMRPILTKLRAALKQVGKKKDFALILEKSSSFVAYHQESPDITPLVIEALNKIK